MRNCVPRAAARDRDENRRDGNLAQNGEDRPDVEQVAWDKESTYRMPVRVWRDLMDAYFPGCAWIRVRRETLDALQRFRARHGFLSWDDTIEALVGPRKAPLDEVGLTTAARGKGE